MPSRLADRERQREYFFVEGLRLGEVRGATFEAKVEHDGIPRRIRIPLQNSGSQGPLVAEHGS